LEQNGKRYSLPGDARASISATETSLKPHLEENVAPARMMLTGAEFAELDRFGRSVER
jgi:hypothetical protein